MARHLRRLSPHIVAAVAAWSLVLPAISAPVQDVFFRDAKAKELFESARIAIFGAPGGIARIRSIALRGTSRIRAADGEMVDARVDVRVLLPDRYLRIDSGSFGRRLIGYSGRTALSAIESGGRRIVPDAKEAPAVVRAAQTELARLMLGMLTFASHEVPLKLGTHDTRVPIPGTSEPLGIEAYSEDGFAARLIVDGRSHLPVRVLYWDADRTVLTITLLDRRPTDGVNLPYRIVTTAGERVVDEMVFEEIVVNPPLDKADFATK